MVEKIGRAMLFVLTTVHGAGFVLACCPLCVADSSYETVAITAMNSSGGVGSSEGASTTDESYEMMGAVAGEMEDDGAYGVVSSALGASVEAHNPDPRATAAAATNARQLVVAEDAEYEYAGAGLVDANAGASSAAGLGDGAQASLYHQPGVGGSRDHSNTTGGDNGSTNDKNTYSGYGSNPSTTATAAPSATTGGAADDGEYLEVAGGATFVQDGFAVPRAPEQGYVNEDAVARALANAPGASATPAEGASGRLHVAGAVAASEEGGSF